MRRISRDILSHWGPWMIAAYLGLVLVTALGFTLNAKNVKRAAAQEAAISRCLTSRPQLERISTHLRGVNLLADVLVKNNQAALEVTPRDDPQWQIRRENLQRISEARRDIAAVKRLPVPTVKQCHAIQQ